MFFDKLNMVSDNVEDYKKLEVASVDITQRLNYVSGFNTTVPPVRADSLAATFVTGEWRKPAQNLIDSNALFWKKDLLKVFLKI